MAKEAKVGRSTILRFENLETMLLPAVEAAIERAFEAKKVYFQGREAAAWIAYPIRYDEDDAQARERNRADQQRRRPTSPANDA